jgi:hypothetical protein
MPRKKNCRFFAIIMLYDFLCFDGRSENDPGDTLDKRGLMTCLDAPIFRKRFDRG